MPKWLYDHTELCPIGDKGVHSMVHEEGSLYVCSDCGITRIRDKRTGQWS